MFAVTIIEILQVLLYVARWIILIQVILSLLIAFNVVNMSNNLVRQVWYGFDRLTEPVYRPLRRVLPSTGAIDFAPMVALILIVILQIILGNLAISVANGGAV